jgi:hypothetical protein
VTPREHGGDGLRAGRAAARFGAVIVMMDLAHIDYRRASIDGLNAKPVFIIPAAFALFLIFGLGPNYELALFACAVLVAGTFLLWRPGEPQILLFLFGFQWLQPTVMVFYANLRGMTLREFLSDPGIDFSTMLVLLGLFFLALGIRMGSGKQQPLQVVWFHDTIQRIPPTRWLWLHLVMLVVSSAALLLAEALPGLSQPLLALANFKWATFLIFTIATFARPDGPRALWFAIFCIEFAMSLGGFFSSFKYVFLYTLIAMTAIRLRLKAKQVVSGAIVAAITLTAGLYWTAIKVDYRRFVNGGTHQQVVTVSKGEAIVKIAELVDAVGAEQLLDAADALTRRLSDGESFAAVVAYVPTFVEHEWGKLWLEAISRPFMPRILFPDKPPIDESELTRRYTGLKVSGSELGTQIGLGYIAESYIDFSEAFMMLPILLFGLAIGVGHRWLTNLPFGYGVVGAGLSSATFVQISVGASLNKLAGGIIVSLLVCVIVVKLMPRYISWLAPGVR